MKKIKITLRSDLCAGSGESYGNTVDSDICLSDEGLPYIPARRLKGCLKAEAARLAQYGSKDADTETIETLFGGKYGQEGILTIGNAVLEGAEAMEHWLKSVKNDEDPNSPYAYAADTGKVIDLFSTVRGQTRMEEGIPVDGSLRYIRVLNHYSPLETEEKQELCADRSSKTGKERELRADRSSKAGKERGLRADRSLKAGKERELRADRSSKAGEKQESQADSLSKARKEQVFLADFFIGNADARERQKAEKLLEQCCKALRHMGLNRNRGMGNVLVEIIDAGNGQRAEKRFDFSPKMLEGKGDTVCLEYHIKLDSAVTIPGCGELMKEIPARSMIGCMSSEYLKSHQADETFEHLFLDGTVRWSALTPVISGKVSVPAPLFLVNLKNLGKYANSVCKNKEEEQEAAGDAQEKKREATGDAQEKKREATGDAQEKKREAAGEIQEKNQEAAGDIQKEKQKTLDGFHAVETINGYDIGEVSVHTVYHHTARTEGNEGMLYMQQSLDAGMIYGGTVILPKNMAETVWKLITEAPLKFGRSRTAQYASCSLYKCPEIREHKENLLKVRKDELVCVVLQSDLVLAEQGIFAVDNTTVRQQIAEKIGLDPSVKQGETFYIDKAGYHTISGYQAKWQMQKPQLLAVRGGSLFWFTADKETTLPEHFCIGEFCQEGFGRCCVLRKCDLESKTEIQKKQVDTVLYTSGDEKYTENLKTALLAAAALHKAEENALNYGQKNAKMDNGLLSRLRLMIESANKYDQLLKNIEEIKESDKSSEKEKSRKYEAKEFVQGLCGNGHLEAEKLIGESQMAQEIENNKNARHMLFADWNYILLYALHIVQYEKEGK